MKPETQDLIERLEKAESGSFELDHQVAEAVHPNLAGHRLRGGAGWMGPGWFTRPPPPYTASIDAIVALIGEKLPEANIELIIRPDWTGAEVWYSTVYASKAKTAPIALCIALLRALDQGGEHGPEA